VTDDSGFIEDEFATATAVCPAEKHLIGTGAELNPGGGRIGFDDVRPDAKLTRTRVTGTTGEGWSGFPWKAIAYSICIDR
jgi:hypothetical protein